ncbi:MAG: beta-lactamase family protein [Clostridia bacterium]|nr:beta-lactamase family protein [Clostridia bacterium]
MNKIAFERLDGFLNEYYNRNKNSGILRITYKDKILYEKYIGFANIEKELPFSKDSVFSLYSLSKPFCTIGLLKLKDKNLVDIDAHPSKYLPEAEGFDSRVTIRQLLHHISGLPDFMQTAKFEQKYKTGLSYELRDHLKELTNYPMVFEPGTKGMYANINFIIPALIIENVSGMSYTEYMKSEVFEPLGMQTAMVDNENLKVDNRVTGYELTADKKITPIDRILNWAYGAGDIIGTVQDVYCLNKAIKHRLLLKAETWEEVLTPSQLNSMGMGCTVSTWHNKKRITHNGGWDGFRTLHIQLPEDDFDIIFLSNSAWGNARNDIAEAVYESFYGSDNAISEEVKMDVGYI